MNVVVTRSLLILFCLIFADKSSAQEKNTEKCGTPFLKEAIIRAHPSFDSTLEDLRMGKNLENNAQRSPAFNQSPIPIIFHLILTQQLITQLGGETGIKVHIDSQVALINRNFNAANADVSLLPPVFKALVGNAGIHFALAQTAPGGIATNGYDLHITTLKGFNVSGGSGSGFGFSGAKYTSAGGVDAWDPTTYLNVWVIVPLDNNLASNFLGLTVPYTFTGYSTGISENEMGIILNYKSLLNNFTSRTLTHELGHFFGLWHVWGDDNGLCPGNGGKDDGIDDTPPQANATYSCPGFPKYDSCTSTGNGIMFMNFMDYTDDGCQHLFTTDQAERMHSDIRPGNVLYSLTQHPAVIQPVANIGNDFVIVPNPASGFINIVFNTASQGLLQIDLVNSLGQVAAVINTSEQRGYYPINVTGMGSGVYYVRLHFATGLQVKKVVVQ